MRLENEGERTNEAAAKHRDASGMGPGEMRIARGVPPCHHTLHEAQTSAEGTTSRARRVPGTAGFTPASGTVTVAVVGIPLFWAMHEWRPSVYVVVVIAFTLASVWLHQVGDRILGEKDSRHLVWDECVQ